ncbi:small S protein [Colletotrichum plurivorum]|uniref:Small S protein n=1 Tax=Colletotrichum plurivorum TaxID=2175906 RepID=A0A8H6NFC7_9PEZI|nr:small S protein [Colletotrichum plurivorum]
MARQIGDLLAAREASATASEDCDRQYDELASSLEKFASEAKNHGLVRAILESLHFAQIKERQNEIPVAHKNTFEWVFREDSTTTFPAWLRGSRSLFWITGKPGSGKSTLMKFIMSHQKTTQLAEGWAGPKRLLLVSHFFWYGGTKIQQSQDGLLRTLLFQILVNYPGLVRDLVPERSGDSFKYLESWSLEELSAAFEFLKERPNLPCCILVFVDGLDEYIGEKKGLTKFLRAVAESPNIKVCCAAEGVFFWVFLVVKSLLKGLSYNDDLESLQQRVSEFPKDLDKFFKRMLDSIDGVHKRRVDDVFAALLMAKSPLPLVFFLAQDSLEDLRHNWAKNAKTKLSVKPRLPIAIASEGRKTGRKREFLGRYRGEISFEDDMNKPRLKVIPPPDRMQEYKDTLLWQCCDLVQAWEVDEEAEAGFNIRIGFLHRTVVDFLQHNHAFSSDAKRRHFRYIHARSFLEIALLDRSLNFQVGISYILKLTDAIQESETDIGGLYDDGYQIIELCHNIRKRLALLPAEYGPWVSRHLSFIQARILVQKFNWESTIPEAGRFVHLYDHGSNAVILRDIILQQLNPHGEDFETLPMTETIDLDLLDGLLRLQAFAKHVLKSEAPEEGRLTVWEFFVGKYFPRVAGKLNMPFSPGNLFDACQILVRHGAPRRILLYDADHAKYVETDVVDVFRECFSEREAATLESLFRQETFARRMPAKRTDVRG